MIAAVDHRPRMHGGIHSQLLHALELRRVDLVHVRQHPTQILDRMFLVHRFDLIEERIDRVVQFRVHMQRQAGLRRSPSPSAATAPADRASDSTSARTSDHAAASKRFPRRTHCRCNCRPETASHRGDLLDATGPPAPALPAAAPPMQNTRTLSVPCAFHFWKIASTSRIAARDAERSEPRPIHVARPTPRAGLELIRRDLGKLARHRARSRDVAANHARGLSGSIAQNRPLDETPADRARSPRSPKSPAPGCSGRPDSKTPAAPRDYPARSGPVLRA